MRNEISGLSLPSHVSLLALIICVSACASTPPPEPAKTYGVGDLMAPALLEDQFGMPHPIDQNVRVILFARDMDGGKLIQEVLESSDPELLRQIDGVYVADIHEMPGFVTRTMAIPKMKKRPYLTLLDRTGEVSAQFPGELGNATAIRLEDLRIWEIQQFTSASALRAAIAK